MAWPLMQEHLYLGASIENDRVVSYLKETPLDEALNGACLFDLTGNLFSFASGDVAQGYTETLCAAERLEPGTCAFSAVLTGDGALVSVPLIIRGGEHEYILLDAGSRRVVLEGWIGFVSSIEKNGETPYANVSIEDASGLLAPLLLIGERAEELISDYTADQALPKAGKVASIAFDGVPCVLAHIACDSHPAYIVFAPPSFAVRLFRSLLSFAYVHPEGARSLETLLGRLPWGAMLFESDRVEIAHAQLAAWKILRADGDFIGAYRR